VFANSPCSNVPSHGPFGRDTRKALSASERNDEHTEWQAHSKRDRSMVDATNHAVDVYPPDIVRRRTVAWDGMAAEIVQATRPEKIEFRFRAPLHLLAVYDQGIRSDGETFVDGLPRSKLRDVRRKLAGLVSLSPYHFCRAFRQSFGTPPHRYHSSHRLERAKTLLVESASSVTEIGMAVGFRETSSFTTAFRKATGQTPTAYRRSLASIPHGMQKTIAPL
jgi:AraC-like DNA-binding protein